MTATRERFAAVTSYSERILAKKNRRESTAGRRRPQLRWWDCDKDHPMTIRIQLNRPPVVESKLTYVCQRAEGEDAGSGGPFPTRAQAKLEKRYAASQSMGFGTRRTSTNPALECVAHSTEPAAGGMLRTDGISRSNLERLR